MLEYYSYEKLTFLIYEHFSTFGVIFSFAFGACIGSFLNVCIWRLPRGENLSYPSSHCPNCNYSIPSYENIPILAWLWLRGKCKNCRIGISPRYVIIETITALIFVFITWQAQNIRLPIEQLLALYFLASAFICIILIDIEHLIIPAKITLSGYVTAGALCLLLPHAIILPSDHSLFNLKGDLNCLTQRFSDLADSPRLLAFSYSIFGFIAGYAILWSVVELGKALFGKQKFQFKDEIKITLTKEGAQSEGDELLPWEDIFDRETDTLEIKVNSGNWNIKNENGELLKQNLQVNHKGFELADDKTYSLEDINSIEIMTNEFILPREAMGRGDTKMLAMIGALLGPSGALFTLMIATFLGCLIAGTAMLFGLLKKGKQIPFGPYLAIAGFAWMLYWPQLTRVYYKILDYLVNIMATLL
ncbi:MAG: prepilin peptidase [Lentisphaerales bacterium]|nr:prepilin peptidase [Lentisphaerales bacterium]